MPWGGGFDTPLLVPSLSSKGFAPVEVEGRDVPAPAAYFDQFVDALADGVLISSYDIHHEQLFDIDLLRSDFPGSPFSKPGVLFIDSGWYEVQPGSDSGEPYQQTLDPGQWNEELYERTIDALAADARAIVVSWDHEQSTYAEQIVGAQRFFAGRRHLASDMLLKPEGGARWHKIAGLGSQVENLRGFDVIGVAEKELGNSLLARVRTLAQLRMLLDEHDVAAPIHVFGSLDPLLTPLYFAAGGEIFDGLGWLRYGYHEGRALHRDSLLVIKRLLTERMPRAIGTIQLANLNALQQLRLDMRLYCERDGYWGALQDGEILRHIYERVVLGPKGRFDGW